MFITIEGVDGSGKSSIAKMLALFFESAGVKVLLTHEPNGEFRELILSNLINQNCNRAMLLAFLANRAVHVKNVIQPALENGVAVICDRFLSSTKAYLYGDKDISFDLIDEYNDFACNGLQPDLEFMMNITIENAKNNILKRGDTPQSDEFLRNAIIGYDCVYDGRRKYPIISIPSTGTLVSAMSTVLKILRHHIVCHLYRIPNDNRQTQLLALKSLFSVDVSIIARLLVKCIS